METNLDTLFDDLMALCESNEAFYYVDQKMGNTDYRIFTYRLASFTDFQNRNAIECRGHTFRKDADGWKLASLPMQKFFNYSEHVGWKTDIDLNSVVAIMDKLDGSQISTVEANDYEGAFFLKSKASFYSKQAIDAANWLNGNGIKSERMRKGLVSAVMQGWTVNMEWLSADNQIVIGYDEQRLVVLNARHMETGAYMGRESMARCFGVDNIVQSFPVPENMEQWLVDAENMTGIEGFVICFHNGLWVKQKTEAYCILHKLKDSINNERRLWEACINETADDLRALFVDDPVSVAKIIDMEEKAAKVFNHADKVVREFYNENKDLDRKSYAIKGQEALNADGLFGIAMNLYLGKDANLKEFLVKNYKKYGVKDEENVSE